jgi:hypothetical protein
MMVALSRGVGPVGEQLIISVEFAGPTLPQPARWSGIHGSVWHIGF